MRPSFSHVLCRILLQERTRYRLGRRGGSRGEMIGDKVDGAQDGVNVRYETKDSGAGSMDLMYLSTASL